MTRPAAIIVLTGSELTRGETRDLNGSFLATQLTSMGVVVEELRLVPDSPTALAATFRDVMARADIVIVSGGLGPTADDHTVRVLAEVRGRGVTRDAEAERRMVARAAARGRDVTALPPNYFKQAEVVEGSTVFQNPVGLAPGFAFVGERALVLALPGVPKELEALFLTAGAAAIRERFQLQPPRILRAKILGLGESWAEERIQKLGIDTARADYGISARPGELLIKFVAVTPADDPYLDEVRAKLEGEFGADLMLLPEGLLDEAGVPFELDHTRLVHGLLVAAGVTVATAESCSGGLIAKRLTDNPGSSRYFLGSVVAYQNDVKERLLGVPPALVAAHGAVSAEVCEAMAIGIRDRLGADYGISTTGVAGPDGGTDEKPVGLVFIGLARPGADAAVRVERHLFWGDRANVRALTAIRALDLLRRELSRG